MYLYSKHVFNLENSPAIEAASKDHINDIMISSVAILGITINEFAGIYWFDTFAGFLIALWIIKTGYEILRTNIDYLMGKNPKDGIVEIVKEEALKIKGVKGLNDVLAQYLGSLIQVEIHVEVDKNLSLEKAHKIGKRVKEKLEERNDINNVFVHIDPV
jgi:cation diffusion facilitator family transporter